MKKERLPRKLKKKIPKDTPYCYTITGRFLGGYYTKTCPFYKHIEDVDGHCKLLNCGVDDQIKSCGLREPNYE